MPGWRRADSLCAAWMLTLVLGLTVAVAASPARAQTAVDDVAAAPVADWPSLYVDRVLRWTVDANAGTPLRQFARKRSIDVQVPRRGAGELKVELSLLPYPPGPAIRLARGRVPASSAATRLELNVGKKSRRRLSGLWVATLELRASFVASTGETSEGRRVFTLRR